MDTEKISSRQAVSLTAFFLTANAILSGEGKSAGQDIWISLLLVMALMLPLVFVYKRIVVLSGGDGFFSFAESTMLKLPGRFIILIFALYSLFLGATVLRGISEFMFIAALTETPQYVTLILLGLLCIWAAKSGLMLISRWAFLVYPLVIVVVLALALLSIPHMDLNNLRSILFGGMSPVIKGAWNVFTFPVIEAALLLVPFCHLERRKDAARVYIISLVITSLVILIVNERNILVMGDVLSKSFYFPSYKAVGIIRLGRFFDRLEILKGMVYVAGGFLRGTFCLYVASQGAKNVFGIKEDKAWLTAALGIVMIILAGSLFKSYKQLISIMQGPGAYAAVFVLGLLPVVIWITAEIKNKRNKKN